ncbi:MULTISPECIES: glycine oxidase ThiO [Methylomonas]|uniref:FAD-dependent oxidoreductase n=1 Tax=Methylomonas koyamae TaxID=702114 RepID=A0A177PCG7_9GAMM|nr:glycine oxidase ThiO [Methylomonas koyamae]OAI27119.1 FAD-dependent oxidoreductase [Methylomonas koyamae]
MTQNLDILIIGGGISGLLAARELRLAGRDVAIIDKSLAGREASWAGGGILLPIYPWRQADAISKLATASIETYPRLCRELHHATGIDPEWRDCGMLISQNPDREDAVAWCERYAIRHQTPPTDLLTDLHVDWRQPLWLPNIAQARNPRLLKSLQAWLRQQGVEFIENADITSLTIRGRRAVRLQTAAGSLSMRELVVSAGAWTANLLNALLPEQALDLRIQPVRGQMLLFQAEPETLPCMVLDGDHYLIPRRDGRILAGSTVEQAGFEKATTESARQVLFEFATRLLPALKNFPVAHHWAGLRPGSPDGVPYIGPHPDIDNLYVNAGHFRNGLVMGPAAARLLSDLMLNRPTALNPSPYLPKRLPPP